MANIADHMTDWTGIAVSVEAKLQARGRSVGRGLQRFVGFLLVLAAFGIWLAPGAVLAAELSLIKMALSLGCAIGGTALWQVGKAQACPELEIDTIRQEVRLVQWNGAQRELVSTCPFHVLSRVDLAGKTVQLWQDAETLLAEVEIADPGSRRALRAGLERAGVALRG